MPDPISLVKPCLNCMGVDFALNIPSLSIKGPKLPDLTIPNPNIPSLDIPMLDLPTFKIPSIQMPGLQTTFLWPSPSMPGLPAMMTGYFGSVLAGINYAQSFLPPDIMNLPSLPTIDLFISGFTLSAPGLPKLPPINITIPGAPSIPFPGMPGIPVISPPAVSTPKIPPLPPLPMGAIPRLPPLPALPNLPSLGFDPSAMLNLIGVFIAAPFLIFKEIIESIINLNLQIPSFDKIYKMIVNMCKSVNIPTTTIAQFAPCLAKSTVSILGALG